jgi:S1-C subfamily serine protease
MNATTALIATALTLFTMHAQAADGPAPPPASHDQIEIQLRNAQKQMDQSAHEIAELSMKLDGQPWFEMHPEQTFGLPRGMLGINVGGVANDAGADGGVVIVSVSPGGPADVAGLKAHDEIVAIGGKELHRRESRSPQAQLLAIMHDAKAGEPLMVQYRRDGQLQTVQVVPKSLPAFVADSFEHDLRGLNGFDKLRFNFGWRDSQGFGSAELLDLSPGLGKYFGTDKGLLVVRAPRDQRFKLQDGDVILDIDGRVPNSSSHASQILSSYRGGERLKLHIMREQKHLELPIEIPQDAA